MSVAGRWMGRKVGEGKTSRRRGLEVEGLERREMLTAELTLTGTTIVVRASDKGDTVTVAQLDNGTPKDLKDDVFHVVWTRGDTGQVEHKDFPRNRYQPAGDHVIRVLNVNGFVF